MKTAKYHRKTYGIQESTTCGIYLRKYCPLYGASPDGICGDFIIEIKCRYKKKNSKHLCQRWVHSKENPISNAAGNALCE